MVGRCCRVPALQRRAVDELADHVRGGAVEVGVDDAGGAERRDLPRGGHLLGEQDTHDETEPPGDERGQGRDDGLVRYR